MKLTVVRLGRCGSAGWPSGTAPGGRKPGGRKPGGIDLCTGTGLREGCDRSLCCHVGAPSPPPAPPVHGTALADTRRVTVTTAKIERTGPSISRCAGRVRARGVRAVRGRVPAGPRAGRVAIRTCPPRRGPGPLVGHRGHSHQSAQRARARAGGARPSRRLLRMGGPQRGRPRGAAVEVGAPSLRAMAADCRRAVRRSPGRDSAAGRRPDRGAVGAAGGASGGVRRARRLLDQHPRWRRRSHHVRGG